MKVPAVIRFVAASACLATAATTHAQPATPLTLNDAISKAHGDEPSSRRRRARGRRARRRRCRSGAWPISRRLSVSGGYTRTNHVDEFGVPQPNGTLRVIYPDIPDNYFTRMSFQWPIYTGGRTRCARARRGGRSAGVRAGRRRRARRSAARSRARLLGARDRRRIGAGARGSASAAPTRISATSAARFDAGLDSSERRVECRGAALARGTAADRSAQHPARAWSKTSSGSPG